MNGNVVLTNEFLLVAACCRWPPSERRNAAIRSSASQPIDWANFVRVVERQRVAGLVHDGLQSSGVEPPPTVKAHLAAEAGEVARQCLKLASEALLLQAAFDRASIAATFVKGTALDLLAYNKIGIKYAWDIDLLIMPRDVRRASDVLAAAGYKRIKPPTNFAEDRFDAWIGFAYDSLFLNERNNAYLELHWRLFSNPSLMSGVTAASSSRQVAVASGRSLRTLGDDDLFSYLCMHGAQHAWSRLKWLADLAAWLSTKEAGEIERLYRKSRENGVGRAAAQALLLCAQLFALPMPQDFLAELKADRATRWLVAIALDAMAGASTPEQTDDRLLGNLKIEISHFLLATGTRAWLRELNSKLIGGIDFQRIALPRPLFFIYAVLRIPSWIWRRAVRLGQSRQSAD
ncbi:MAG: nucleotidyltransferase family protein [Rhizomicrobium sp.]